MGYVALLVTYLVKIRMVGLEKGVPVYWSRRFDLLLAPS